MPKLKYLARGFVFEGSADDGATYTQIKGVTEWGDALEGTDADATDFDSGGWGSALTASLTFSLSLTGQLIVDPQTGQRDAGQKLVETAAKRIGPLGLRRYRVSAIPTISFVAEANTETLLCPGHGYSNGTQVRVFGDALPTGLTDGGTYYVIASTDDTVQLSLTSGGSAVALTADGEGEIGVVLGTMGMTANAKLKTRGGGNDDLTSWGCDLMSYGRPSFTGCFAD